ncbi:MAG: hypothetical protein KC620_10370 [Myxococcales bacterium]|nr:hypothetical protein [Myxococcales bacterium]
MSRAVGAVLALLASGCISVPGGLPPLDEADALLSDASLPDARPDQAEAKPPRDQGLPPDAAPSECTDAERNAFCFNGTATTETCNGADDDCDGAVDEGTLNTCGRCGALPAEVCDGVDNNCDAQVDEGCPCSPGDQEACGTDVGECTIGWRICGGEGRWLPCDGVAPQGEVCDGHDDDCDGAVDEGLQNACGACGPVPAEVCNREDDDCDGRVDEGVTNACHGCGALVEVCNAIDDDCDGQTDEGVANACGECGAVPDEECNLGDDDCDGRIDEDACDCMIGAERPCGTDIGRCELGLQRCDMDGWGPCAGGISPRVERCDQRDDDCDGAHDEDFPTVGEPCVVGVGRCERDGTLRCTNDGAGVECSVREGSPAAEACNRFDDDCDGRIDEDVPEGDCQTALAGACRAGRLRCQGGQQSCEALVQPRAERCNGADDDCDGPVDEAFPNLGAPCSVGVGACRRTGETVCTPDEADTECSVRAGNPSDEVCNGRDDDCDGQADEGLNGAPCMTGQPGACGMGTQRCLNDRIICDGPAPMPEQCNGIDDDCNGTVDDMDAEQPCETGLPGRCGVGLVACNDGVEECIAPPPDNFDGCDGVDDDCDGAIDEDELRRIDCSPCEFFCRDGRLLACPGAGPCP